MRYNSSVPGVIAQLGEHLHGMQGVKGSSPFSSTKYIKKRKEVSSTEAFLFFKYSHLQFYVTNN